MWAVIRTNYILNELEAYNNLKLTDYIVAEKTTTYNSLKWCSVEHLKCMY
jgi:hypothetical protein